MADNPVRFTRRFYPAQIAPEKDVGAGLTLTLRLKPEQKVGCDPQATWVGVRYEPDWENLPPVYTGTDGEPVDWSILPIQTLVMWMDASASGESVSKYLMFAAVTGACGAIEWSMDAPSVPSFTLYPMGPACYVLLQTALAHSDLTVTLKAALDGVDLAPLVWLIRL